MMKYDEADLRKLLETADQTHLLSDFGTLCEADKQRFAEELGAVDFGIFERAKLFEEKVYDTLAPMTVFSAARAERE